MISISLCMIVKNEEGTLWNCLHSVKDIVDQIVIVDTGSTDRSIDIAREFTDEVHHFEWVGDFAAARNYSFSFARCDYILWLDADDVLLDDDREKLKRLKETLDPSVDSVSMIYNYGFDEYGNVTLSFRRNRLVKRSRNFQWYGDCHVYLKVDGKILDSDIAVSHKRIRHSTGRNLAIYENRVARGDRFTPRDHYYYGNELRENGHFEKAIEQYQRSLQAKDGWVEDKISACLNTAECYRILGKPEQELTYLLKSFEYGIPTNEACYGLGDHFQRKNNYRVAIHWYHQAIGLPRPDTWGFYREAFSTWLPHLQLCVCYYRLGQFEKSYEHNEMARKYRPNDPSVLHNKKLLEEKLGI